MKKQHQAHALPTQQAQQDSLPKLAIHTERSVPRRISAAEGLETESEFFSDFETYSGKGYDALVSETLLNEGIYPKRLASLEEDKTPKAIPTARLVRYLSAGAAFAVVFTALVALKPYATSKSVDGQAAPLLEAKELQTSETGRNADRLLVLNRLDRSDLKIRIAKKTETTQKKKEQPKTVLKALGQNYMANVIIPTEAEKEAILPSEVQAIVDEKQDGQQTEKALEISKETPKETKAPVHLLTPPETAKHSGDRSANLGNDDRKDDPEREDVTKPSSILGTLPTEKETEPTEASTEETTAPAESVKESVQESSEETTAPTSAEESSATETRTEPSEDVVVDTPEENNNYIYQPQGDELEKFYKLVAAEASPFWDYGGQMRIAKVVMNRLKSGRYGNTLTSVIEFPGQFTPVMDGSYLSRTATEVQKQAVRDALAGGGSDIFDDTVIGFCTEEVYRTNPYFRDGGDLEVVEHYGGVVFFKFSWT